MHRVDRRLQLYRQPPVSWFDPGQFASEDSPREQTARRMRGAVRSGRPVVLRHARWSEVPWLLQDVAADLRADEPSMDATVVHLGAASDTDTWTRVPELLARVLGGAAPPRAMAPAGSEGFRLRTAMALRKGRAVRRRKVLLCPDAEAVGFEALQGICDAWGAARDETTPGTCPLLVLALPHGGRSLEFEDALSLFLPDPSPSEAVKLVAELIGAERARCEAIVRAVGTVPAFLRAALDADLADRQAVVAALGEKHHELRRAVELACTEDSAASRLETLAERALPFVQELDGPLQRMGLVTVRARRGVRRTGLRSPLVAGLLA